MFEVLIVVAIMAMIATVVGVAVLNKYEKAKRKHALTNATEILALARAKSRLVVGSSAPGRWSVPLRGSRSA